MAELSLEAISVKAGRTALVKEATTRLKTGELVALIGPNGAGKTSLLRGALGLSPLAKGTVTLDGKNIHGLSANARARRIAYLPQARPLAWPSRVRDVVALGRFAYGGQLSALSPEDAQYVDAALNACDISALADRKASTLSGGESARMHCARAFAANTPLLIADEPVAALDPRQQLQVLALFRRYVDEGGGALIVLHDIELAARFATRLIWMKGGEIAADGPPSETLSKDRMADIFGVEADVSGQSVTLVAPL
ncbi:MAG: ABC transporter ATP-binding protein [Pseudomonadota bacterium]